MQVNNFYFKGMMHCVLSGLVVRNLVVIAGVLLMEWRSLGAIREFFVLLPRALARRRGDFFAERL